MPDIGSTMTYDRWMLLSHAQRLKLQQDGGLTAQLIGLEGCRVEVVDEHDQTRRFLVSRSTGWRPCHIELCNIRSSGGISADKSYKSVRVLYRQRPQPAAHEPENQGYPSL